MIPKEFADIVRSNEGCAVIMAGSDSDDKPPEEDPKQPSHIEIIANSLEDFQVPYEVRIKSIHKQPGGTEETVKEYDSLGGSVTYIAVAGGTDALSGGVSYHSLSGAVLSCPPDAPNESCTRNPPGSCNAYVPRPENIGKIVAQIYAGVNPAFRGILSKANERKIGKLEEADVRIRAKYAKRQVE